MTIKWSRHDYLNNLVSHREYYAQFVTRHVKSCVMNAFTVPALVATADQENLNSIPLHKWDRLASLVRPTDIPDPVTGTRYYSLCSAVCILKEAAKQLIEEFSEEANR